MANVENLNSFASEIGNTIFNQFKGFVSFVVVVALIFGVFYLLITVLIKWKRNRKITEQQNQVIHKGRIYAKKFKLRNLYTSIDGKKMVKIGKIVAYVMGSTKNGKFSVFAVKGLMMDYDFYKTKKDRHSELFGDVILYDWNFGMDKESRFMILNTDKDVIGNIVFSETDKIGVDTIGNLSPIIQNSVQVNPRHRIRLRESKLIKIPDDSRSSELSDEGEM